MKDLLTTNLLFSFIFGQKNILIGLLIKKEILLNQLIKGR